MTADDFGFARASMSRRARRGLSVGDYLHTQRVGLRIAWEEIARKSKMASRGTLRSRLSGR